MEEKIINELARKMAAELHKSESKEKVKKLGKGDNVIMIGSKNKHNSDEKQQVCMECGEYCYFRDTDIVRKDIKKNVKIKYCCGDCAVNKHKKKMTALQQEVMGVVYSK